MSLSTVHNTYECDCGMCRWAQNLSTESPPVRVNVKEIDQWELEKNLREYDQTYGRQALLEQIFRYMAGKC